MCQNISHKIKCMEKKFTHMTKIFPMNYKISHPCQKIPMHVKCWCGEHVFSPTLVSHGSVFSHTIHMIFTHIALVVIVCKHIVNIISAYNIISEWKFSYIFNSQCPRRLAWTVTYGQTNCSLDDKQCSGTFTERILPFSMMKCLFFTFPTTLNTNIQHYAFCTMSPFDANSPLQNNDHSPKESVANYYYKINSPQNTFIIF